MTLATIFLLVYFLAPSATALPSAGPQPDAHVFLQSMQDVQGQAAPTEGQGENRQNAAAAPAKSQAGQQTTPAKPHRRRKKPKVDCGTLPAPTSTTAEIGSEKSSDGSTGAQTPTSAKASRNCPPEKIVVRHGGSTDPSIQLAGGTTGGQAAQQKATANQMLESTEENLKKLEGRQLSASDQATVTQIRQYIEQSKSAITANDMERARTLAWKAQTLSDDLANPKQ